MREVTGKEKAGLLGRPFLLSTVPRSLREVAGKEKAGLLGRPFLFPASAVCLANQFSLADQLSTQVFTNTAGNRPCESGCRPVGGMSE